MMPLWRLQSIQKNNVLLCINSGLFGAGRIKIKGEVMATTWKQTGSSLRGDLLTYEVQEVVGGVDGKKYSVTLNKARTETEFKDALKAIINADRTKTTSETTLKTKVDLSAFETFLNT